MLALARCQFRFPAGIVAIAVLTALLIRPAAADSPAAKPLPVVRVGALKFGTVNWELDVMARHHLDRANGFALKTVDFAGKDGADIALQGGAVDIILTDWLWVAKRRALGGDFTFVPHSHITGGLMVRRDTGIATLADLKGKKIGIGGGPADKSWIILRAFAQQTAHFDPEQDSTPVFAAPPLLNATLERGAIPAAVNFWQYESRLDASRFVELIPTEDMLRALGLPPDMPLLGWVFSAGWARAHPALLKGYLAAAAAARTRLADTPAEWRAIRRITGAKDDATLERLRAAYGRGIVVDHDASPATLTAEAQRMIGLLGKLGDREEVPPNGKVPPGTFFAAPSS
jgi:NitT/TauT family transport system substrate-binding protein